MRQEKKSGKSFFKTAADAEKYLNEKNEDTVLIMDLKKKSLMNRAKYPMMCQIMDCLVINRIVLSHLRKKGGRVNHACYL